MASVAVTSTRSAPSECFRTVIVGGRLITLRIPFGQNNERSELAEGDLEVLGGGKADPAVLWKEIELILASPDFARYVETLGDGREKALVFDLERRTWAARAGKGEEATAVPTSQATSSRSGRTSPRRRRVA